MDFLADIIARLEGIVYGGPTVGGETLPLMVLALLGTGLFLTLRLGFVQLRRFAHGVAVTTGRYDDPNEPGDVPHFQALTTALSATVGIGNIAGVAIAIHWGGPGALFWMWVTALLGMAVKYSEVTLAQQYRVVEKPDKDPKAWEGSVSGGPMYYIERGLGKRWKPLAVFFAVMLMTTSFLTGNAVQANTVADVMNSEFGVAVWITGLVTALIVGGVILGGISRIGKVTGVLAPAMALVYVVGALVILALNIQDVPGAFALIFREAFNPSAGVAGTGTGALLVTMMWGVRRGLFSNEAGQGSAPIAHAAAKTDEPVSEGVVALLEPFIDTILICTMTGLVLITTAVWDDAYPTTFDLNAGAVTYVAPNAAGRFISAPAPAEIRVENGVPQYASEADPKIAWTDVAIQQVWADAERTQPFTGRIVNRAPEAGNRRAAIADDGTVLTALYGDGVRNGAPLTIAGFERGLGQVGLGGLGKFIVILSVLLFAISTAIAWSYYGDRCANYLFGARGILPFKAVFVGMHFVGAVTSLNAIWALGDVALGLVTFPNLLALILLSPVIARLTRDYFARKPWIQNAEDHKRAVAEQRARRQR
ncbi:MAG: alanine/glycine:cation symporter family protein [Rubricoccaceae bacterium]